MVCDFIWRLRKAWRPPGEELINLTVIILKIISLLGFQHVSHHHPVSLQIQLNNNIHPLILSQVMHFFKNLFRCNSSIGLYSLFLITFFRFCLFLGLFLAHAATFEDLPFIAATSPEDVKASLNDKPAIVFVTQPWCGACKRLKSEFSTSLPILDEFALVRLFNLINLMFDHSYTC